jgi:hypothetical protein
MSAAVEPVTPRPRRSLGRQCVRGLLLSGSILSTGVGGFLLVMMALIPATSVPGLWGPLLLIGGGVMQWREFQSLLRSRCQ